MKSTSNTAVKQNKDTERLRKKMSNQLTSTGQAKTILLVNQFERDCGFMSIYLRLISNMFINSRLFPCFSLFVVFYWLDLDEIQWNSRAKNWSRTINTTQTCIKNTNCIEFSRLSKPFSNREECTTKKNENTVVFPLSKHNWYRIRMVAW